MFVVIGATGKTGSAAVDALRSAGKSVRAVVRKPQQVKSFELKGVEAVVADVHDGASLLRAFEGCEGAYLMNPPAYGGEDMFADAHEVHASLIGAAEAGKLSHIVALSSVGAQHSIGTGNILTTHDFENQLTAFKGSVSILRAANFMENWASSMPSVQETGNLPSMFLPLDRAIPMVAAKDIGATAAQLLMNGPGPRLFSLESRVPVSPNETATVLSRIMQKRVTAVAVDEADFAPIFLSKGLAGSTANAFSEMFKGFNSGYICFEGNEEKLYGDTTLEQALTEILRNSS